MKLILIMRNEHEIGILSCTRRMIRSCAGKRWRAVHERGEQGGERGKVDGLARDVGQDGAGTGQGAELGRREKALGGVLEGVDDRLEAGDAILEPGEDDGRDCAGVGLVVMGEQGNGGAGDIENGAEEVIEGIAGARDGGLNELGEGIERRHGGEGLWLRLGLGLEPGRVGLRSVLGLGHGAGRVGWGNRVKS